MLKSSPVPRVPPNRPRSRPFRLTITAFSGAAYVPYLRRYLRAANRHIPSPLKELSVALVGDRRMAELHQQFMGLPGPTDVLTFPLDEDRRGRVTSGEVVLCIPEARRRARGHGVSVRQELLLYALHGMLHLCGFDDRTDAGFAAMHRTEDQILTQIGVGPVFATPERDDGAADGALRPRPWTNRPRRAGAGSRSSSSSSTTRRSKQHQPGRGAEPIE
jgi:rRNA maturation RNase YbeY